MTGITFYGAIIEGTCFLMSELDEFAEALMGQLSVEIDEEKVIAELAAKIKEYRNFTV